ncbi:MAG TPA: hypothetical protein VF170_00885, partial [Planctomycetaceae bacterium]
VAELKERLDPQNHSAPARQIAAVAEQMRKFAAGRLAEAERDLQAADRRPEVAFEAALTVLTLRDDFAELPGFGEELTARVDALEQDRLTAPLFEQAKKAVEAEALFEAGRREEAIAALTSLSADAPDGPAAGYVRRTLARWEKERRTGAGAGESAVAEGPTGAEEPVAAEVAAEEPDASSEAARQAEGQLRLGKVLLSRSPAKARKYFERAIELAPDSPAAAEARELLDR